MTYSNDDIVWGDLVPPEKHPAYNYDGFHPGKVTNLPKGYVHKPGFQAFPIDVTLLQDVAVKMKDGVNIYVDIYRPAKEQRLPALIAWSPYGKGTTGVCPQNYDSMGPCRIGIPYQRLSGFETFEGPNPADWTQRGYNVIDPDARGACHSEGNITFWGQQEAEDIDYLIDWVSKQPWCDGNVVMFGNSWLAIAQINYASRLHHPALKAIAPWEALTDPYRDQACRGGMPPDPIFSQMIMRGFSGYGKIESLGEMARKYPLFNGYWQSKQIAVESIELPMYLTASYSTGLHSMGSFRNFAKAGSEHKWLRVHNSQEWHDLYRPAAMDDLQRFYDYFAKNKKDNGWIDTPRLRLSLLGFYGSPAQTIRERPENDTYPLSRTKMQKFYLDAATSSGHKDQPSAKSQISYKAHDLQDHLEFKIFFDKYTELSGLPWIKLFISCTAKDDMDIHIMIRKINNQGDLLEYANYPMPLPIHEIKNTNVAKYLGPTGMLRASHAVSMKSKSHPDDYPEYEHTSREPITPLGKVVELDIPIWPIGMVFEEGEGVAVIVAGHRLTLPEVGDGLKEPVDENVGEHVVYTGGEYGSFVMLPFITE